MDLIERQAATDKLLQLVQDRYAWQKDALEYVRGVNAAICAIDALPSAEPEITNEEIRFSLKQLRVYLAIKIRDGKEGGVPVELLKRVEEIQKYFENVSSAQPDVTDTNVGDTISRQDAVSRFSDLLMLDLKGQRIPTWEEVYNAMQDLPSAQPDIIRCKDCVYWDSLPSSSLAPEYHECVERPFHINTTAEDFCSRAERRQE